MKIDSKLSNFPFAFQGNTIEYIKQCIVEYFNEVNADKTTINNHMMHAHRYLISINYIAALDFVGDKVLLEAGGKGIFTYLMDKVLGMHNIVHSNNDFRDSTIGLQKNSVDNIICMEVIEHIADDKRYHEMQFQGVKCMLKHFFDILKPGGVLLTTPNITSYASIGRILKNKNPMSYPIHVREYSPEEILLLATQCGYNVDMLRTEFAFIAFEHYGLLHKMMIKHDFNCENRGDTIFAVLKKPYLSEFKDSDLARLFLELA
jgi:predicted SAM-dependent methyltransferase